jgi:hypothetical protein
MQYPTQPHYDAVMWAMGYLIKHLDDEMCFGGKLKTPPGMSVMPAFFEESRGLYGASDSSWGQKPRPQAGHAVMRMNAAIHWQSNVHKMITDSSAHGETAEASRCTKALMFTRAELGNIRRAPVGPSTVQVDSKATHDLVVKDGVSSKSRHFERMTILVKYAVMKLMVVLRLIGTAHMVADIFTKPLDKATFMRHKAVLKNQESTDANGSSEDWGAKLKRVGHFIANTLSR